MTKKNIWLVGAGGFARELYSWLQHHDNYNKSWLFKGFVDDLKVNSDLTDDPISKYPGNIVSFSDYTFTDNDLFLLAVGEPKLKEKITTQFKTKNLKFTTFIHPTAIVGQNVQLGEGVIICPFATISCDSKIGDFVLLNLHGSVGHDTSVGDYTTLSGHSEVTGHCTIGKGAYLGTHATLVPKTIVEDFAIVGAGTVGLGIVKTNTTILGVPGKRITFTN